jgi:hypothetical protein
VIEIPPNVVRQPGDVLHLHAKTHLGRVQGGGSAAQLYKVNEDDRIYVIKLKGNGQGLRVLFNEYVGGRLGELIGVPFGEHALITVDAGLYADDRTGHFAGIQFGTVYYEHAQVDIIQLRKATNFNLFPSVLVFDTLIALSDGPQHMVLPSSGDASAPKDIGCVFDHGYAFTGTPLWSAASLQALAECAVRDDMKLKDDFRDFNKYEPYIESAESLKRSQMEAVIHEAPLDEWKVPAEEATALLDWLERRKGLLRAAIKQHLGVN